MAGLPSHIFVVRHGNRLDAADKQWHLSSPTPYDPPLTYGGWLQARQVGNQISNLLERVRVESEGSRSSPPTNDRKRKRFKVVIHSSPFLRCVQTSIGISSGLSQTSGDGPLEPADLIVPPPTPMGKTKNDFRSSILRLDSYLGEWLTHEYFENITPPPPSSMMLGTARADLLKREDYSSYTDFSSAPQPSRKTSLWSGSRPQSPAFDPDAPFTTSPVATALPGQTEEKRGYGAPRPTYAVSGTGKIPDGFVAHARDACLAVDYQWDSTLPALEFGDGGNLGEEWVAMHRRFRSGMQKMLNWYASSKSPERIMSVPANREASEEHGATEDEEVETVVIIVSHGAGCNALIGTITHQPVLMDVGIASITMASRKMDADYDRLRTTEKLLVPVDQLYNIKISASTEHLRSTPSTPVSSGPSSMANVWNTGNSGTRGRTSTLGGTGPSLGTFTYSDMLASSGSRSTSAGATVPVGTWVRRDSEPFKPAPRQSAMSPLGVLSGPGSSSAGRSSPPPTTAGGSSAGLWSRKPSGLRLMDDGSGESDKEEYKFPDFDQKRFKAQAQDEVAASGSTAAVPTTKWTPKGPRLKLAAPMKLQSKWEDGKAPQEVNMSHLGEGLGGLWGQPRDSPESDRSRESSTKRRWTICEQNR